MCDQNYNKSVDDTNGFLKNVIFYKSYGMTWDGMGVSDSIGSVHVTLHYNNPHNNTSHHIISLRLTGNIDSNQGPFWPHIELSLFCRHSECRNKKLITRRRSN